MNAIDPNKLDPGQAYRLMGGCIVPRPIAWITTVSKEGKSNAAPFSFFNGLNAKPPLLTVAIGQREGNPKDTLRNIIDTGEFVVNVVTESNAENMAQTAANYPAQTSEIEALGLATLPSDKIAPFRLQASPIQMECKLRQTVKVEGASTTLVIGEVVMYHVHDDLLVEGTIDQAKLQSVGRIGNQLYTKSGEQFPLPIKPIDK